MKLKRPPITLKLCATIALYLMAVGFLLFVGTVLGYSYHARITFPSGYVGPYMEPIPRVMPSDDHIPADLSSAFCQYVTVEGTGGVSMLVWQDSDLYIYPIGEDDTLGDPRQFVQSEDGAYRLVISPNH